jgi:subtilase family serine protease
VLALGIGACAETHALITQPINEQYLVTLGGNTRPEANAANDLGRVTESLPMQHMLLQLQHSPQQEKAVNQLIDQLHDPKSSNYHRWLTADQFGQRFGVAQSDLTTITGWLNSHGLSVDVVYTSGMLISFSGAAGQVREAFDTEIHNLKVNGVAHIANMSDPKIPAALAPAVAGVVSLHDFMPKPMLEKKPDYTTTLPGASGTYYPVTPRDLETIYNIGTLYKINRTGAGETIVVLEDSNTYSTDDFKDFRETFGLNLFTTGLLRTTHPAPPRQEQLCRSGRDR